jgi:predicted transcriptional regulator
MIDIQKIENIRKGLRLSQKEMAYKIWLHVVNYNKIVKWHTTPRKDKLERIVELHNNWYKHDWFITMPLRKILLKDLIKSS